MSESNFKEFLKKTVDTVRTNAEKKATECVINIFKSKMTEKAEQGILSGCIYYDEINLIEKGISEQNIYVLKNFIGEENIISWVINKVLETNIFDGICIEHNKHNEEVKYFW